MEKFRVVVADPPWEFNDKLKMSAVKRGAEANYNTLDQLSLEDIPVDNWTQPNAVLALWVPSALIAQGLYLMTAWGFQEKQIFTWVKTSKKELPGLAFGMGRHFRNCTEHALIGIKGKISPKNKSMRNICFAQNLKHSQKPELLQNMLEEMYDGPYLELFARRDRPNWTCIGNEIPGNSIDIRDWDPYFEDDDGTL